MGKDKERKDSESKKSKRKRAIERKERVVERKKGRGV
jgi:hypothetical protein